MTAPVTLCCAEEPTDIPAQLNALSAQGWRFITLLPAHQEYYALLERPVGK
jgi:hypothetical protein